MGSPLDVLFASMYLKDVEEITISSHPKPKIYAWYIKDIFNAVDTDKDATRLQYALKENLSLNFTIECGVEGRLLFLDEYVDKTENRYNTNQY